MSSKRKRGDTKQNKDQVMRRVEISSAGGYDKLHILEEQVPMQIPPGCVLVRTTAVGVNYADVCVRMGLYASAKKYVGWPITPGFEFSGVIVAVGPEDHTPREDEDNANVEALFAKHKLKVGSKVFGVTRFFGYATHIVVRKHLVLPHPAQLDVFEAAGFPAVFFTAYYALHTLANVQTGMSVLIHSAAGGVGSALVQLAAAAGCTCIVGVVGSTHKVSTVVELGASHCIDKSTQSLWHECERIAPHGFDIVLDANGVSTLRDSYNHLAAGGKLVVYGFHSMLPKSSSFSLFPGVPNYFKLALDWLRTPAFSPLDMTGANKSVMGFNLSYLFNKTSVFNAISDDLLKLLKQNKIVSPPITYFALENVKDAHKAIESAQSVGKIVLITDNNAVELAQLAQHTDGVQNKRFKS